MFARLVRPGGVLILGVVACSSGGTDSAAPSPTPALDIGLTGGADGLEFEALAAGGVVPLHTFGQGGTHALLAVRCIGLGNRAFVSVTISDPETGAEVSAPAGVSPRLLACDSAGVVCDLLPLLVMTGGLVPPNTDRAQLPVRIRADASNAAAIAVSVERDAVLDGTSL